MLSLANYHLRVELLDPVADHARLGPRYCWGGFIWQVRDLKDGPLLAGPEWPKPAPIAWNGQGLPESFRHRRRDGSPLTWQGGRGVALGAGELALNAKGEVEVIAPCVWKITQQPHQLIFHTRHRAAGFDYELERKIELASRVLVSSSRLTNHGGSALNLEWFAHPFFPLSDRLAAATLPEGTTLPDNPAFALRGRELTQKRRFESETDGHLDFPRLPDGQNLVARVAHPALTQLDFETSFAPSECLLWGNSNTFSLEPYQVLALAPGETKQWSLRYTFGAAKVG